MHILVIPIIHFCINSTFVGIREETRITIQFLKPVSALLEKISPMQLATSAKLDNCQSEILNFLLVLHYIFSLSN